MTCKVYSLLTAMLLASCAGNSPPPQPTTTPTGLAASCDTASLENRIRTLEAEKESLQAENRQFESKLNAAGQQLTDQEKVATVLGLCTLPKSVILQVFCALSTQIMLQNCGITDNGDGTYTLSEPTAACPSSVKRILAGTSS